MGLPGHVWQCVPSDVPGLQEAATAQERKAEEEAADTEVPAGEAIAEGQEKAEKAGAAKVGKLFIRPYMPLRSLEHTASA